jgi:hypothetical protein
VEADDRVHAVGAPLEGGAVSELGVLLLVDTGEMPMVQARLGQHHWVTVVFSRLELTLV